MIEPRVGRVRTRKGSDGSITRLSPTRRDMAAAAQVPQILMEPQQTRLKTVDGALHLLRVRQRRSFAIASPFSHVHATGSTTLAHQILLLRDRRRSLFERIHNIQDSAVGHDGAVGYAFCMPYSPGCDTEMLRGGDSDHSSKPGRNRTVIKKLSPFSLSGTDFG